MKAVLFFIFTILCAYTCTYLKTYPTHFHLFVIFKKVSSIYVILSHAQYFMNNDSWWFSSLNTTIWNEKTFLISFSRSFKFKNANIFPSHNNRWSMKHETHTYYKQIPQTKKNKYKYIFSFPSRITQLKEQGERKIFSSRVFVPHLNKKIICAS